MGEAIIFCMNDWKQAAKFWFFIAKPLLWINNDLIVASFKVINQRNDPALFLCHSKALTTSKMADRFRLMKPRVVE